jgi:hypothetical protein
MALNGWSGCALATLLLGLAIGGLALPRAQANDAPTPALQRADAVAQLQFIAGQVERVRRTCKGDMACLRRYKTADFFQGWVLPDNTAWTPWHTELRLLMFPSGQVVLRYAGVPIADCPALLAAVPAPNPPPACTGVMPEGTAPDTVRLDVPL